MKPQVTILNRQRARAVDTRRVRQIAQALMAECFQIEQAELSICFVAESEMMRLNEAFLRHASSTDVITFDYSEFKRQTTDGKMRLHGEIFICLDEAIRQARTFRTSWQSEIVRYLVHGILHLLGHDDLRPNKKRKMKREEDRLLRQLSRQFSLAQLAPPAKLAPCKNR